MFSWGHSIAEKNVAYVDLWSADDGGVFMCLRGRHWRARWSYISQHRFCSRWLVCSAASQAIFLEVLPRLAWGHCCLSLEWAVGMLWWEECMWSCLCLSRETLCAMLWSAACVQDLIDGGEAAIDLHMPWPWLRETNTLYLLAKYELCNCLSSLMDPLMDLFRGVVFHHAGVPESCPLVLMGRFPSLMGDTESVTKLRRQPNYLGCWMSNRSKLLWSWNVACSVQSAWHYPCQLPLAIKKDDAAHDVQSQTCAINHSRIKIQGGC